MFTDMRQKTTLRLRAYDIHFFVAKTEQITKAKRVIKWPGFYEVVDGFAV